VYHLSELLTNDYHIPTGMYQKTRAGGDFKQKQFPERIDIENNVIRREMEYGKSNFS
jgi:hypothetical protein